MVSITLLSNCPEAAIMTVVYFNQITDVTENQQMPMTSLLKSYHEEKSTNQKSPRRQELIKQYSPYR